MNVVSRARCDAEFKKQILLKCCDALEAEGFSGFRKLDVDYLITKDIFCWVGLNTGLYRDKVEVNPFVGVHVVSIDKLWTSLKRGKYPGKCSRGNATYAVHMGTLSLASEARAFAFAPIQSAGFIET